MDPIPLHPAIRIVSRLFLVNPHVLIIRVFLVACIAQGWCLQVKAHLAATIVVGVFIGLGSGSISVGKCRLLRWRGTNR